MKHMQKMLCAIAALVFAAGTGGLQTPAAQAETFAEMKNSIPTTATFIIDGQEVTAPVLVPDVDTLPIGYSCPLNPGKAQMKEIFGKELTDIDSGHLGVTVNRSKEKKDWEMNAARVFMEDGVAPNSSIAPERAEQVFFEILEKSELGLSFRAEKTLARSGAYKTHTVKIDYSGKEEWIELAGLTPEQLATERREADLSKPVKGYDTGEYVFIATQLANGVPIFFPKGEKTQWVGPFARVDMRSEDFYTFSLAYVYRPCGVGEEAELLPFEQIVEAVQARIDSGMLQNVDSLELGYAKTTRTVKGREIKWDDASESNPNFALIPVWKVNGFDLSQLANRAEYGFEEPDAFERYAVIPPNGYYICLNAMNGALWDSAPWKE